VFEGKQLRRVVVYQVDFLRQNKISRMILAVRTNGEMNPDESFIEDIMLKKLLRILRLLFNLNLETTHRTRRYLTLGNLPNCFAFSEDSVRHFTQGP